MDQKKHAACDECRARKLKCSGNVQGCDRCVKDQVRCIYSPQKPMGRPRKRRRADDDDRHHQMHQDRVVEVVIPQQQPSQIPQLSQGEFCAKWDDGWSRVCDATTHVLTDEFSFMNGAFVGLKSIEAREEHMSDVRQYLAPEAAALYAPTPTTATPSPDSMYSSSAFGPGCNLPTCTCSLDLFSAISTLQTTPPSPNLQHCLMISRGAIASAKASLMCPSCLSSLTSAYSSFMLLSITLPLLVLFYKKSLASIARVDPQWTSMAQVAVRKEFGELQGIVDTMDRLSQRKEEYQIEDSVCQKMTSDGRMVEAPLCRKILKTVKIVAATLQNECEEIV